MEEAENRSRSREGENGVSSDGGAVTQSIIGSKKKRKEKRKELRTRPRRDKRRRSMPESIGVSLRGREGRLVMFPCRSSNRCTLRGASQST